MKRPWFGDRLLGIGGLRPVTWEGWLVAVALVAVVITDGQLIGFHQALGFVILGVAIGAYAWWVGSPVAVAGHGDPSIGIANPNQATRQ